MNEKRAIDVDGSGIEYESAKEGEPGGGDVGRDREAGINEGHLEDNSGSFNVKIEIIPEDSK